MKKNKVIVMAGLLAASLTTGAIASPLLHGTQFQFKFYTPQNTSDYTTYSNMQIAVDSNSPVPGYLLLGDFVNQVTLTQQNPTQLDGVKNPPKVTPLTGSNAFTGIVDLTFTPTMGSVTFSPITFQLDFSKTAPVTQNVVLNGAICQGLFTPSASPGVLPASLSVNCLD